MKKRICLLLACFSAFALVLSCAKGIGVWQEEKTSDYDKDIKMIKNLHYVAYRQ